MDVFFSRVVWGELALFTVWEGSKQILTLAGFLAVAGRSRTTMLDIHGIG